MPRYFFHVKDGEFIRDTEGTDLANDDEARVEAITASGEILAGLRNRFWNSGEWQMIVTDERGKNVCTLVFSATSAGVGPDSGKEKPADAARPAS